MLVGYLKARLDYTDVRDIVRGYWLLLEKGTPGEVYNLCSGTSHAIQEILDFFLAHATVRSIAVREDPARLRPSDLPNLYGSPARIHAATGWQAEIPFEQTLQDVLDYWRVRVRREPR
jgi:GDP-4-dehydro-6-deoxy-D-mannose reductase